MGNSKGKKTTSGTDGPGTEKLSNSPDLGIHLVQISWRVAFAFLIFSIGGVLLDRRFDTEPLWSLVGLLLALISTSSVVYRYVLNNFPETFGGKK